MSSQFDYKNYVTQIAIIAAIISIVIAIPTYFLIEKLNQYIETKVQVEIEKQSEELRCVVDSELNAKKDQLIIQVKEEVIVLILQELQKEFRKENLLKKSGDIKSDFYLMDKDKMDMFVKIAELIGKSIIPKHNLSANEHNN